MGNFLGLVLTSGYAGHKNEWRNIPHSLVCEEVVLDLREMLGDS